MKTLRLTYGPTVRKQLVYYRKTDPQLYYAIVELLTRIDDRSILETREDRTWQLSKALIHYTWVDLPGATRHEHVISWQEMDDGTARIASVDEP